MRGPGTLDAGPGHVVRQPNRPTAGNSHGAVGVIIIADGAPAVAAAGVGRDAALDLIVGELDVAKSHAAFQPLRHFLFGAFGVGILWFFCLRLDLNGALGQSLLAILFALRGRVAGCRLKHAPAVMILTILAPPLRFSGLAAEVEIFDRLLDRLVGKGPQTAGLSAKEGVAAPNKTIMLKGEVAAMYNQHMCFRARVGRMSCAFPQSGRGYSLFPGLAASQVMGR